MSRWAPLLFRSTRPGLGVVATSSSSVCVTIASTLSASTARRPSRSRRVTAAFSSSRLCRRREAQPRPRAPQTRQRRSSFLASFCPSRPITSMSNRRPMGLPSSIRVQISLTAAAEALTAQRNSLPVSACVICREMQTIPASPSASSSIRRPSSKARRIIGLSLTGPGMFMVKEISGRASCFKSRRCASARRSRASSISCSVTSLISSASPRPWRGWL